MKNNIMVHDTLVSIKVLSQQIAEELKKHDADCDAVTVMMKTRELAINDAFESVCRGDEEKLVFGEWLQNILNNEELLLAPYRVNLIELRYILSGIKKIELYEVYE